MQRVKLRQVALCLISDLSSRSQIKHEPGHSSTEVFLIGDYKFTISFGTLLTDSQVKKSTGSCIRSEMTGTTAFNKIVYDTYSTTGWFNTNDVVFFNTHRANFLAEVTLFITSLFPENVSCLASRNSIEQGAATTVLETRSVLSVDKRNMQSWEENFGVWRYSGSHWCHTVKIWMI